MRGLNLNFRPFWSLCWTFLWLLCAFHPLYGQIDSTRTKNTALDTLIRYLADSIVREDERRIGAIQPKIVYPTKEGVATEGGIFNFSDTARQDSMNRTKVPEQKMYHHHISPIEQRYEQLFDSLRKALDSIQIKKESSADSGRKNTSPGSKKKPKATSIHMRDQPAVPKVQQPVFSESFFLNSFVSPRPDTNFSALEQNNPNILKPDAMGAAGLNHLMVTLNTDVRIQNRQGGTISTTTLNNWWAETGASDLFDPRVAFDPYARRWIFTALSNPNTANSSVLIAVSLTSDPTGPWNKRRIDADAQNLLWADYPSLGFNKKWICVSENMYLISGQYNGMDIYVFDKAGLYAGGQANFKLFKVRGGTLSDNTRVPAITYDDTLSFLYLVRTGFAGDSNIVPYVISGEVGQEVLAIAPSVAGQLGSWYETGFSSGDAPQLGANCRIETLDNRMQNVVYRDGVLWCTHTIFLPRTTNGPNRSSAQWWKLYVGAGIANITLLEQGRIDDPTNSRFYAYPSVSVNINNDMLIGHSRFSSSQYASGNYSFRTVLDPPNTTQADTILKAGETFYALCFIGFNPTPWGDFTATMIDPLNDLAMWTIQEYAESPPSRWGTWWGRVGNLDCPVAKGDLNLDALITSLDVVKLINATFLPKSFPAPFCTSDLDCNRALTPIDIDLLVRFAFLGMQPSPCNYQF